MKTVDLILLCEGVEIFPDTYKEIKVYLNNVDMGNVLNHFSTSDIISHFDKKDILDEIGKETCCEYFDLREL